MSSTEEGRIRKIEVCAFQGPEKFEIRITPDKLHLKDDDVRIQISFNHLETPAGTTFVAFQPTDKQGQICNVTVDPNEISLEDLDSITGITIPYSIEVRDPSGKLHWSDPQIINKPRRHASENLT